MITIANGKIWAAQSLEMDIDMQDARISGQFYVDIPPDSAFDINLIDWADRQYNKRGRVIINVDDASIDQSNMDSAIQSILVKHQSNIRSLIEWGCKTRLVMGFFFDTSKVSAFGLDISELALSFLTSLRLDITIDVFPCSDLES